MYVSVPSTLEEIANRSIGLLDFQDASAVLMRLTSPLRRSRTAKDKHIWALSRHLRLEPTT